MFSGPSFYWALLGLLLIAAEMFLPGFVIFFFGSGAIITGFLSILIPGVSESYTAQGIIWMVSSLLTLGFFRKKFAKIFKGTILNKEISTNVGQSAEVIEAIAPDKPGRVRYHGTSWRAISYTESFEPGAKVDIIKEDNLTFIVSGTILDEDNKYIEKDDIGDT